MALPFRTTGSLRPTFVPGRLVRLSVKHPYAFALNRAISDRAEGTFVLLRYSLGGDRPSQTAQLALSTARIHGNGVRIQAQQGWCFNWRLPRCRDTWFKASQLHYASWA